MENCENCPCNCKPVSNDCISRNSDINDPSILKASHFQKATDDIDDLIGVDCANQLCESLQDAVEEANINNNTDFKQYLAEKWLNIINNKHFQKWYSNRLLFHFVYGTSISELSESGLIVLSNTDTEYKNGFNQAGEEERKRIERTSLMYSSGAKVKFLSNYWNKNLHLYDCHVLECGCTKENKCKAHCEPKKGISSVFL